VPTLASNDIEQTKDLVDDITTNELVNLVVKTQTLVVIFSLSILKPLK